jgi:hypothetical protein
MFGFYLVQQKIGNLPPSSSPRHASYYAAVEVGGIFGSIWFRYLVLVLDRIVEQIFERWEEKQHHHLTTTMVPRTTIDRLPHEICVATAINSLQVCNYYYCFLSTHPWVAIPVDSTLVSSPAMRRWICGYLLVVSNSPPKIYI